MAANADEPAVSPDASPHSHRQAEAQNLLVHDSNTVDFPRDQPADRPDEPGHQIAETDASKSKAEPFEVLKGPGFLSLVYTRWLTELLASLIALLAFAAIVITLATHNGRPLPNWPFGISINALVSIFAVILKGTMMVPVAECK
jgi:hypothetical protein